MAAELVETSRLWGREVARIDPRWIEPLAGHLDPPRALRAALGRAPRAGRRHRADDALRAADRLAHRRPRTTARLFIRQALVEGEWHARHPFLRRERAPDRGGRGDRGAHPPARPARARRRARRLLRRPHPRRRQLRPRLRPLVPRAGPGRCSSTRASCCAPSGADGEGRPETWKQGELRAAADLPLRARRGRRRRHRPRRRSPTLRARARRRLRLARPRAARGARDGADPRAARRSCGGRSRRCRTRRRASPPGCARARGRWPARSPRSSASTSAPSPASSCRRTCACTSRSRTDGATVAFGDDLDGAARRGAPAAARPLVDGGHRADGPDGLAGRPARARSSCPA